jgi:hypothetical protein
MTAGGGEEVVFYELRDRLLSSWSTTSASDDDHDHPRPAKMGRIWCHGGEELIAVRAMCVATQSRWEGGRLGMTSGIQVLIEREAVGRK